MDPAHLIETQLRAESPARFPSLPLPAEWVSPDYGGRSIVNVTATVARIFGAPISTPPLDPAMIGDLLEGVRRVVFVVVDALGYAKLLETLDRNPQNGLHALLGQGARLSPVTSVFPSTTTAALTSLWSGYSPYEHGFLGYQLFLRDYGVRANMISFSPVATDSLGRDQLIAGGLEPENFVATPSLAQTLARVNVPVYHLLAEPYIKSGLSRVQIRDAQLRGFMNASDMWVVLREMVEQKPTPAVFAVYWSGVDSIGHFYGPSSPTLAAEIDNLAYSFEREFLRPLSPTARRDTLFLLTADHGQIDTPPARATPLQKHPELRSHLVMDFAGGSRAAYLYCRNGEMAAARSYIENNLGDRFLVLDSSAALQAGLFGSGTMAPETPYRTGDLIVLPRADYSLVEHAKSRLLLGR
ncbi:MAG: alkaline phosphatase family protein, partial [Acidobacteriota bacterium]